MGDSQIFGVRTRSVCKLHIIVLELKAVIFALQHWVSVLQGHHVMIATDNTTVVAYINKQGRTHSHTHLSSHTLVVDQAGSGSVSMATVSRHSHPGQTHSGLPQYNSRPVISAEPAYHNRVESPPRISESNIQAVGDSSSEHVCHSHNTCLRQFMSQVPEPRAVAIDALSQDWQGRSMYMFPLFPLMTITTVVSTLTTSVCGPPSILSIPPRPNVTTGICLE